jgi:hypothetical protein
MFEKGIKQTNIPYRIQLLDFQDLINISNWKQRTGEYLTHLLAQFKNKWVE